MGDLKETTWEHIYGDKSATMYTSERSRINELMKLKEEYPNLVEITAVNKDGSIVVHIPAEWMKLRPRKKCNLSDEQRAAVAERLRASKNNKKTKE